MSILKRDKGGPPSAGIAAIEQKDPLLGHLIDGGKRSDRVVSIVLKEDRGQPRIFIGDGHGHLIQPAVHVAVVRVEVEVPIGTLWVGHGAKTIRLGGRLHQPIWLPCDQLQSHLHVDSSENRLDELRTFIILNRRMLRRSRHHIRRGCARPMG
jgi:hypothetical protein